MSLQFDLSPVRVEHTRVRGDTASITFTLLNPDGTNRSIAGFTYRLTVDTQEDPPDAATNVFVSVGTVVSPNVTFPISLANSDNLGDFFFDVEETDAGGEIRTIIKGPFTFLQDISK